MLWYGWLFLRQEKTWKDSKRRFSIYCSWVLCSMDCLQFPFIRVEKAVAWTQPFLTRKFAPKIEVYLWQTNLKANVCKHSTFQVNRKKNNGTGRGRQLEQLSRHEEPHNNPFGYKLGESTENNKALLFFSGKEIIQTFSGSDLSLYTVVCGVINLWNAMFENSAKMYF